MIRRGKRVTVFSGRSVLRPLFQLSVRLKIRWNIRRNMVRGRVTRTLKLILLSGLKLLKIRVMVIMTRRRGRIHRGRGQIRLKLFQR